MIVLIYLMELHFMMDVKIVSVGIRDKLPVQLKLIAQAFQVEHHMPISVVHVL